MSVTESSDPALAASPDPLPDGLPPDVLELAAEYLSAPPDYLAGLLTAPLRFDTDWPQPEQPLQVAGGWVQVEVTDEDRATFEALVEQWQHLDPERFAAACQELRLPVCPYRSPTSGVDAGLKLRPSADPGLESDGLEVELQPGQVRSLAGASIVDLSTHWAGPLATKLLAEAGASVIKIDPACRPDGFRSRPRLYQHLNGDKQIIDLDLRQDDDRAQFEALVAGADLLVESFSRRVMSNLGYGPDRLAALFPRLATLSIKAFPKGTPEAGWLAFGPGVHAATGLGHRGSQTPRPAPIAYPDFLTGLAGFTAAAELVDASIGEPEPGRAAEVSLAGSIAPLIGNAAHPNRDETAG